MTIHVVHFAGPVSPKSAENLRSVILQALVQKPEEIWLHISSEGGNVTAGFDLYHFIKSLPVPVTTHNVGTIQSIALIVYLAGDTRKTVPHSKFLMHDLNWTFGAGSIDHARLAEFASALDFERERYIAVFNDETETSDDRLDIRPHLAGSPKFLTGESAVKHGIAHALDVASIPVGATTWWPAVAYAD